MATTASTALERDLTALLGPGAVLPGRTREYLSDATESRNLRGKADAVALPKDADQVAETVAWCYEHDVAIIPRGGGTGFTGGAVPLDGGVVLSLENLKKVRHLDPGLWRAAVEAGVITADLRRRARENGLFYPPDPGSAEQSQLGGNIATNAGGPHAFKYGVTGAWVTGLEVVLAPGELVEFGGPIRKDVAGYDIKSLMIGSEGTLGDRHGGMGEDDPCARSGAAAGRALPGYARPAAPRSRWSSPAASSPRRSSTWTRARSRRPGARSRSRSRMTPGSW